MLKEKKDICVIGIGRFGYSIVEQLIKLKKQVLAIDIKENQLIKSSRITNTAIADGTDIDGLKALGIDQFNIVIVAVSENIEIVAALVELNVKYIIAKGKSIPHERVLKQIGVDVIIKPEIESGIRTALIATNPSFIKYSESLQEIGDGYAIGSTIVNDTHWLNKSIKSLKFHAFNVSIVCIKRKSKVILPSGTTKIKSGDLLTIIGKVPKLTKIFNELNNKKDFKIN